MFCPAATHFRGITRLTKAKGHPPDRRMALKIYSRDESIPTTTNKQRGDAQPSQCQSRRLRNGSNDDGRNGERIASPNVRPDGLEPELNMTCRIGNGGETNAEHTWRKSNGRAER